MCFSFFGGNEWLLYVVVSYKFKVMTGCEYTDNYQSQTIREFGTAETCFFQYFSSINQSV